MALVCNFDRLEAISMGEDDFAAEMVRVFLDDSGSQIGIFQTALEQGDVGAAMAAVHRMKGAAGNVGAEVFADACRSLEALARQGQTDGLAPQAAELRRELDRVRETFQEQMGAL
ncbi:MAG: Hpt domain-containing protein [Acidobacteria bacterium]|nr:Hpt domain-containing protein [Acidobacteriota bacterium]